MANKITKKQMFEMIKEVAEIKENPMFLDFIQHEIDLLNNKAGAKKPTKTQTENETFKGIIFDVLNMSGDKLSISEIQSLDTTLAPLSNQKMSALLRQMKEEQKIDRKMDKKVPRYFIKE